MDTTMLQNLVSPREVKGPTAYASLSDVLYFRSITQLKHRNNKAKNPYKTICNTQNGSCFPLNTVTI
jgi:hypothetical protein